MTVALNTRRTRERFVADADLNPLDAATLYVAGAQVRAVSTFDRSVFTIFDGRRGAPQEPRVLFVPATHRRECKNAYNA